MPDNLLANSFILTKWVGHSQRKRSRQQNPVTSAAPPIPDVNLRLGPEVKMIPNGPQRDRNDHFRFEQHGPWATEASRVVRAAGVGRGAPLRGVALRNSPVHLPVGGSRPQGRQRYCTAARTPMTAAIVTMTMLTIMVITKRPPFLFY